MCLYKNIFVIEICSGNVKSFFFVNETARNYEKRCRRERYPHAILSLMASQIGPCSKQEKGEEYLKRGFKLEYVFQLDARRINLGTF